MTWAAPIAMARQGGDDAQYVVEQMTARDVDLDMDSVRLLISVARQANRRCLSAWLRANEPEHMASRDRGPYARWINRRRGNAGRFRDGSDLSRAPLVAVYFLVNEWWRRETGMPFHPDFRPLKWGEDFNRKEQLDMINPAALFFTLIAGEVDLLNYTAKRCSLIHDGNYKKLDKRIP